MSASIMFAEETSGSIPMLRETDRRVGRWNLRLELATGGMATVYLAYAERPSKVGTVAALKLIHPHLAKEQDYVDMFLDEAKLASLIDHPNVCRVIEFGHSRDTYFIAMEYLQGEPLGQVQRALHRRMDPQRLRELPWLAARIVADAAEGLHAAHELRNPTTGKSLEVVHRDVSPSNVIVTYDGSVRIVDFGVARAADRLHHTRTGTVKGKFAYMAPEQMLGRPVDRRADVWALGVLLWETIALRRLFRRNSDPETVIAVGADPIPRLCDVHPGAPPALEKIVRCALARNPDERYASAREMADDLSAFLAKSGHTFAKAELSQWMRELFARRITRRQQLVELATHTTERVPSVEPPEDIDGSSASLGAAEVPMTYDALPAFRQRDRRRLQIGAAVGLATVIVAGAGLGLLLEPTAAPVSPTARAAPIETRASIVDALGPLTPTPPAPIVIAPAESSNLPAVEPAAPPSPRRRSVARAVAPAPGRVAIVTIGAWAEVFEGGRRLGQTPGTFALPSGRRQLALHPFGGSEARRVSVDVEPGQTARVRVDLR